MVSRHPSAAACKKETWLEVAGSQSSYICLATFIAQALPQLVMVLVTLAVPTDARSAYRGTCGSGHVEEMRGCHPEFGRVTVGLTCALVRLTLMAQVGPVSRAAQLGRE